MKPIPFKEQTGCLGKDQDQFLNLPVWRAEDVLEDDIDGAVVSCWKLTFWERIKLLFTGRIWNYQLTYHELFRPTALTVDNPFSQAQKELVKEAEEGQKHE